MALLEGLARAGERIAFGVDQVLDLQSQFYILTPIKPLAGSTLAWFELRKLRFPEAQDVGFYLADAGHIPNFEIEAVGDCGRI